VENSKLCGKCRSERPRGFSAASIEAHDAGIAVANSRLDATDDRGAAPERNDGDVRSARPVEHRGDVRFPRWKGDEIWDIGEVSGIGPNGLRI
jgi:hypothetical protein